MLCRDMFIFDDPLRYVSDDAEAALLFKNMSDYLLQTGKTILITTTNEEVSLRDNTYINLISNSSFFNRC